MSFCYDSMRWVEVPFLNLRPEAKRNVESFRQSGKRPRFEQPNRNTNQPINIQNFEQTQLERANQNGNNLGNNQVNAPANASRSLTIRNRQPVPPFGAVANPENQSASGNHQPTIHNSLSITEQLAQQPLINQAQQQLIQRLLEEHGGVFIK